MHDATRSPWILGKIRITEAALARVLDEARSAYARDEESCGVLVGPADDPLLVDACVPMPNRANALHALDPEAYPRTGRMYFDIDPMRFERAVREGSQAGRPVKVLYHSHLDVGAYFSETDAAAATAGGSEPTFALAYLVTSVRKGAVDAYKLFTWDPASRGFVESSLDVQG